MLAKKIVPGQVLILIGEASILLSIWSAGNIFNLIGYYPTLISLFLVIAAMGVLAVVQKAQPLAIFSIVLISLIPFQSVNPDSAGLTFLMAYGFFLNLTGLIVVLFRKWRSVLTLSLFITSLYSLSLYNLSQNLQFTYLIAFAFGFYATLGGVVFLSKKVVGLDVFNNIFVNLLLISWVFAFSPNYLISTFLLVLASISLIISTVFNTNEIFKNYSLIQFFSAITFLVAGTAYYFQDNVYLNLILIILELFFAQVILGFGFRKPLEALNSAIISQICFFFSLQYLVAPFIYSNDGEKITVFAILTLIYGLNYLALNKLSVDNKIEKTIPNSFIFTTAICFTTLIWLGSEFLISNSFAAHALSLVLYTLLSLVALYFGKVNKNLLYTGYITIGFVVARLILVEFNLMPVEIRIVTFIVIGVLLLLTAFMRQKGKPKI